MLVEIKIVLLCEMVVASHFEQVSIGEHEDCLSSQFGTQFYEDMMVT